MPNCILSPLCRKDVSQHREVHFWVCLFMGHTFLFNGGLFVVLGVCFGVSICAAGVFAIIYGAGCSDMGIILIGIVGVFMGFGICSINCKVWNKKRENKPENVILKEQKIKALQEKLSACEIEKTLEIPFSPQEGIIKYYNMGVSTKTKQIVFYFPIERFSDEDDFESISFQEIIGCELIEDNETIQKGGIGRAFVGGFLAGGVGAIVGATTRKTQGVVNSLQVKIVLKDILSPGFEINIITKQVERGSGEYRYLYGLAQEIYNTILAIEHSVKDKKTRQKTSTDNIEELRKCKQLLDEGIISSEEFERKKKQLLNL